MTGDRGGGGGVGGGRIWHCVGRVEKLKQVAPNHYKATCGRHCKSGTAFLVIYLACKGPVIQATFFFNLSRNIVALQVETLCCAYYHICDQLVLQQNTMLQVWNFMHIIDQLKMAPFK